MKNNTLIYRVEQMEKNYNQLDLKIDKILTNHLPHIQADIIRIKTEVRILAAINIGALLITRFL